MNTLTGGKKIGFYVITTALTAAFLMAGGMKVSGQAPMIESFQHFGLPMWFMYFIGTAEILGAIALWLPRLSALSASGLMVIMAGAFTMHAIHDPLQQAVPAVVFTILLAIIVKVRLPLIQRESLAAKAL